MPLPTITSFSPATAKTGDQILITGTNFTGTTSVKFGGINAVSFIVVTGGLYITAVVGSGTTGSVSVTNATGTASLTGFTFTPDNCGCPSIPDSCIPSVLIPACDNPEYCESVYEDKCILHKGDDLVHIGTVDGDRLNTILLAIDTKLALPPAVTAQQIIDLINGSSTLRTLIAATV